MQTIYGDYDAIIRKDPNLKPKNNKTASSISQVTMGKLTLKSIMLQHNVIEKQATTPRGTKLTIKLSM